MSQAKPRPTRGETRPSGRPTSDKTSKRKFGDKDKEKGKGRDKNASAPSAKKPEHRGAWVKRPAKGMFEPDPKDANTVNSIRAKLEEIREYKRILAQDGMRPDEADKERESNLIKQLIRIEKGLPPIKPTKKKSKKRAKPDEKADAKASGPERRPIKIRGKNRAKPIQRRATASKEGK